MKNCVERSLVYSTEIIIKLIPSTDKEIQMVAFESLALVFDKSRDYYSGQRTVYRQSLGAPEAHANCIKLSLLNNFWATSEMLAEMEQPKMKSLLVEKLTWFYDGKVHSPNRIVI